MTVARAACNQTVGMLSRGKWQSYKAHFTRKMVRLDRAASLAAGPPAPPTVVACVEHQLPR